MRNILIRWLQNNGFLVKKSIYLKTIEIDIGALARVTITKNGVKATGTINVFAFEAKIATTSKLARDVVEQAITRLLVADYVYVVVPSEAEVWRDRKTKAKVYPGLLVRKLTTRVYSKNIGIIAIDSHGDIKVVKEAKKSGLVIDDLRNMVIKKLNKAVGTTLF